MNPTLLAAMLGGGIGTIVGWLVRYFVVRLKNYTITGATLVGDIARQEVNLQLTY